jgi:N-acetylglucosamine-6-phosphate deacetylase
MILHNARLVLSDRVARGELRVRGGRIEAVSTDPLPREPDEELIDLGSQFVAPGFIDLHIHGALERDTMEADAEAFRTICRFHAGGGTTSLALSTITATTERIIAVLEAVRAYRKSAPGGGAQVLGVHVEGPYFSPEKPGAHQPELIRHPKPEEYEQFLEYADTITQMTIAPELPGALELIGRLRERNIRVSGGHSDAWDEDAAAAFSRGMAQVTHTYNCMSSARRRGPYRVAGLLEFALSEPEILCEVIADGRHVSPTLLRMLYQAKGPAGIALITDAAPGAGLAEGARFGLAAIECVVRDHVGLTADGRALAGSTATMNRCVRNMVQLVGVSLPEAVQMATLNPARALGIESRKGLLRTGFDADLVVFNDELDVTQTYLAGERIV